MAKKDTYKPFVRSIYDLGDYNDDEVNNEPSMTDPSQDEPIDKIVARLLRGEQVNGSSVAYDTEISNADGVRNAFDGVPHHERDGFDIADAPVILDAAKATLADAAPPVPAPVPGPAPVAPVAPPPDLHEGKPN